MSYFLPKTSAAILIATAMTELSATSAFAFYCDDCYGPIRYYNGTDLYGHVGAEETLQASGGAETGSDRRSVEKSVLGDADENRRIFHANQTSPESTLGSDRGADGRYRR